MIYLSLNMVGLFKTDRVIDLYHGKERTKGNIQRGFDANVVTRRIFKCLHKGLDLAMDGEFYQWTEERSPNYHQYVSATKWPVSLIQICSPTTNLDRISFSPHLQEFNFKPIIAANSSGGVRRNTIDKYEFSMKPSDFTRTYASAELEFMEYLKCLNIVQGLENEGKEYNLKVDELVNNFGGNIPETVVPIREDVSEQLIDFMRVEGFDDITGTRIFLDLGNKPDLKKIPKGWFGFEKDVGQLPPKNSMADNIY